MNTDFISFTFSSCIKVGQESKYKTLKETRVGHTLGKKEPKRLRPPRVLIRCYGRQQVEDVFGIYNNLKFFISIFFYSISPLTRRKTTYWRKAPQRQKDFRCTVPHFRPSYFTSWNPQSLCHDANGLDIIVSTLFYSYIKMTEKNSLRTLPKIRKGIPTKPRNRTKRNS